MPIDLDRTTLFVAGAAMLAVAVVILAVRPGRGLNRALAALVAARGAAVLLPQASNDPAWAWAALNAQPYFTLAVAPLALYCMHVFAHADGPGARRGAGWLALGAVAALDLLYFADHGLLHSLSPGTTEVGALRAADGIVFTGFGPLALVAGAVAPVLAYLGLRVAVQYRETPQAAHAPFFLLVGAGLTLGALFDGASRLAALTALLDAPGGFPWLPWGWAVMALPVVALGPATLAAAILTAKKTSERRPFRTIERAVLVLAAFAVFSGFLRLILPSDSDVGSSGFVPLLMGTWRLAMPAFVGYAIVRYPLGAAAGADPPSIAQAATREPQAMPR
ncbi:MAG: hypothetical protein QOJ26_307 [Thermoplasmata archaeon]|jgi:hypothetical protein|nr:hypothetical protein [Thermoplasmata archaeon]MEA3165450.1 hypothetical protein [Thermoplasmata archaeon]